MKGSHRRLSDRTRLLTGIIAAAASAVFEPALHYYLAAHGDAPPLYHHLNSWGNLGLALVILGALLSAARTFGIRLLATAGLASVTVTALNVSFNEMALRDPSVEVGPALF